jgi:hypothetical protein
MNRYVTRLEHLDFALINVHAKHVVAGVSQTGARDQAHVA